jgi:hypothetical protein
MNREHLLINSERLKVANWAKWIILISTNIVSMILMSLVENLVSITQHIPLAKIYVITFYIRGFITLSLIHDLAPRFKKTISIIWSMYLAFIYLSHDAHAGDKLYLGTLLFIILNIIFNIFIYRRAKKENSNKTIISE